MRAKWVGLFLALGLVAAGTHWMLPEAAARAAAWDVVGVVAVAASWFGLRSNRPDARGAWMFLALGLTLLVVGDLVWDTSVLVFGHADDYVPLSDIPYLSAYPMLGLGLFALARRRNVTREGLLDATIVSLVLLAPMWQLVVRPTFASANGASLQALPNAAYPLLDVFLIVLVVFTAFTLSRWNAAVWLLFAGLVVNTVGDIVYARLSADGTAAGTLWLNAVWPVSYVLIAAAMLHPSVHELSRITPSAATPMNRARVVVLAIALFAMPAMLAVQLETGEHLGGSLLLVVASLVIACLIGWRIIWLVREIDRSHEAVSRSEDLLQHQAFHDALTGLPNRLLLLDRLGQALLRNDEGTVAVLFLDLDRFKVINDSLGHEAGDELLLEVSRRLEHALKAVDTVARFGGDEFVIVCERVAGAAEARSVAERVAAAFIEPFTVAEGGRVSVTASIGIAVAVGPGDAPTDLLRDADAAMYRAKEQGRARIEVFDAVLRSRVVVRLETERSLRRAVARGELRVRYQPIVELSIESVVGAEALMRWRHPTRGLIAPGHFIDVAEETGLIVPMGEWMIGEVVEELAKLRAQPALDQLVLSVNLSARQFMGPELVDAIRSNVRRHDVDPARLCLEVTESVLLDDVDASAAALHALKDLGVRLAVDDFGTGYSSLGYLKMFPFDQLKIDQAFTAGLGENEADDAIVLATVRMAHALGMEVVLEGVETQVQRDRACELGCDFAQGYLFAPPQRASEVFAAPELDGTLGSVAAPTAPRAH
jgi:diguanylate cyclase